MDAPNFSKIPSTKTRGTAFKFPVKNGEGVPRGRFRSAILGLWMLYAIGMSMLFAGFYEGWQGIWYGLAMSALSGCGPVALFFWKPSSWQGHVTWQLYLQLGGMVILSLLANLLLVYGLPGIFENDRAVLWSLTLLISNSLLLGGIIWMVFFNKGVPYAAPPDTTLK